VILRKAFEKSGGFFDRVGVITAPRSASRRTQGIRIAHACHAAEAQDDFFVNYQNIF
jgi:hypothetical protein